MAIIRVNKDKNNPYVTLNKTVLEDENLSFKAKGIHAYLMSKPDDWKSKIEDLVKQGTDGKASIYSGLKELRACGYLIKRPIKNKHGAIIEWEEVVYEIPQEEAKKIYEEQKIVNRKSTEKRLMTLKNKKPLIKNQNMDLATYQFSTSGFSTSGKPLDIINTNILSTNILNNEISISTTSDLKSIFEGNICLLKTTTEIQFNEYLSKYNLNFIKAVIIYCIRCNAKSFAYFKTTIDKYINMGITTAPEFLNQVQQFIKEKYSKSKIDNKNGFVVKNEKVDAFNNFEQRKYDFDELEKELLDYSYVEGDVVGQ